MIQRKINLLLLKCCILLCFSSAKSQTPANLSKTEIDQTVTKVASLLKANYVNAEKGKEMEILLLKNLKNGKYKTYTDPVKLSEVLKNDLQDICNDKHVYLNFIDANSKNIDKPQASAINYNPREPAFQNLKILPGNIGYVEITHFLPTKDALTDVIAAMNYLSKADAIIFDLRRHKGGNGEIVQLILSYLFSEPTLINTVYNRSADTTYQMWTHEVTSRTKVKEYIPGQKSYEIIDTSSTGRLLSNLHTADIYVLTSDVTFSSGEEFAYDLQCQKRATLIGGITGAGGNPTRFYPVNMHFVISIPWAKSINPISKKGWEGVGVVPDIAVHPSKALEKAHLTAIAALITKTTDPKEKSRLGFDLETAKALYAKTIVSEDKLKSLAGSFGEYGVYYEEGILYSKKGRSGKLPLFALNDSTFQINDDNRLVFVFDSGAVKGIEIKNKNGTTQFYKKQE